MIKKCERENCCNFFTVGRKKKYCSQQCGDIVAKLEWKKRNRKKYNEAENARRRRKYQCDATYRGKCIERSNATYHAMTLEERRSLPRSKMGAEYHRKYMADRANKDMDFRLRGSLRARVRLAISTVCGEKAVKTIELIGCSVPELRAHLEQQFTSGMTWDNYGDWHIDHIKPCAAFDLTNEDEQRDCFHYSNLQPLWASDNMSKGAKWDVIYEPS